MYKYLLLLPPFSGGESVSLCPSISPHPSRGSGPLLLGRYAWDGGLPTASSYIVELSCSCRQDMTKVLLVDNLILKLTTSPMFRLDAPILLGSRWGDDWSIQSERRQKKFQNQVVYQENLRHFNSFILVCLSFSFTLHTCSIFVLPHLSTFIVAFCRSQFNSFEYHKISVWNSRSGKNSY